MYVVLGILAASGLGGIIYMFLSKKSSKLQKTVAMGALILSGVVLGICGAILIFGGDGEPKDPYYFPLDAPPPVQEKGMSNISELLIFLLILLVFFGFIVFLGIRDRKKHHAAATGKK